MASRKKVYIALSGGVDSSVAALKLVNSNFNCTGVYFKLFKGYSVNKNINLVKKLCEVLDIPFKIFDLRKEFREKIINYFISEYKLGKTPNPCVLCNKYIKFGLFLKKSLKEEADFIVTGHYARNVYDEKIKKYKLLKGRDKLKDQSYFLYRLNQYELSKSLFPLGNLTKFEVRKIAVKNNLPTVKSKESQEICFLKDKSIYSFLKKYLKTEKGNIIDTHGNILCKHNGYFNYTIGQREKLGIGGTGPYYVIGISPITNNIIVSNQEKLLFKNIIEINNIHLIKEKCPKLPLKCKVSIRYQHKPFNTVLYKENNRYYLHFQKPQRAPTPGQSVVIYLNNECLGGGIITNFNY